MLEEKLKQAIIDELKRQAEIRPGALRVTEQNAKVTVNGEIDIDELAMVVAGAMAGGP